MRVALVALVLVIGAAVVLVFANTLNTWVLGGLLGGLAAILLSIPISLALFTVLTRRHEARQRQSEGYFEDEPHFVEDSYQQATVYESENYPTTEYEEPPARPRSPHTQGNRHQPVSGYLRLPPPGPGRFSDEELSEQSTQRELHSYPRQPRMAADSPEYDEEPVARQNTSQGSARHNPSTRSLAQHQSRALRLARQEALQQHRDDGRESTHRPRPAADRSQYSLRTPPNRAQRSDSPTSGSRRMPNERESARLASQQNDRRSWEEDRQFEQFSEEESRERYSTRTNYPRQPRSARSVDPRTGSFDPDYEEDEERPTRRPPRDTERQSGNLRNPLVRRAPYLYSDDPMREELAQQLDSDRPITRRSSRYEDEEDEEY
jgi:hypothetical protein